MFEQSWKRGIVNQYNQSNANGFMNKSMSPKRPAE